MPQKLTRAQIKEGLQQIPLEYLLSAGPNKKPALTSKMKSFAHNLALGKTQAQAYRESYNTKATPKTQGDNASRLARDSRIKTEREAFAAALQAEKHRTPAQLKSLLVQQLVQHSLDEDFPPAQRVQCLKLLGSLFEVNAFSESRTTTVIHKSGDIRARLLATLQLAQDIEPKMIDDDAAATSLLEELAAPAAKVQADEPTGAPPARTAAAEPVHPTHTISDIGSSPKSQQFSEKSFRGDPIENPAEDKFEDA
jgi:hypothetical protein